MRKCRWVIALTVAVLLLFSGCGGGSPSDPPSPPPGPEEPNMADYPLYEENYASLAYSADDYKKKMSQPYWLGNVIYNEIALPVLYENGECYVKLLYTPERVISVLDHTLQTAYVEGRDYTVDRQNKRLVIPTATTTIATWADGIDEGKNVPAEFKETNSWASMSWEDQWVKLDMGKGNFVYAESPVFYGSYLNITYAYDIKELPKDTFHTYDKWKLTETHRRLAQKQDIKLAVLGDSISEGCSSSEKVSSVLGQTVLPNMPPYATQVKNEIERVFGVNVTLTNEAIGGDASADILAPNGNHQYALANAKAASPDLCIIGFGMNDRGYNVSPAPFSDHIQQMIDEVRSASPDCEFILLNSFPPNPLSDTSGGLLDRYLEALQELADGYEDGSVVVVDMLKAGNYMLQTKRYCEISSSNMNHPNDFFHRMYAANIMTALCDYKK